MVDSIKTPRNFEKMARKENEKIYRELESKDAEQYVLNFIKYLKTIINNPTGRDAYDYDEVMNNLFFAFLEYKSVSHFSGLDAINEDAGLVANKFKKTFLGIMKEYMKDFGHHSLYNKYITEKILKNMREEPEKNTNEIYEELTQNPEKTLVEIYEDVYYEFWDMVEKNVENHKRKSEEDILEELSEKKEIRFYKKIKQIEEIQEVLTKTIVKNIN